MPVLLVFLLFPASLATISTEILWSLSVSSLSLGCGMLLFTKLAFSSLWQDNKPWLSEKPNKAFFFEGRVEGGSWSSWVTLQKHLVEVEMCRSESLPNLVGRNLLFICTVSVHWNKYRLHYSWNQHRERGDYVCDTHYTWNIIPDVFMPWVFASFVQNKELPSFSQGFVPHSWFQRTLQSKGYQKWLKNSCHSAASLSPTPNDMILSFEQIIQNKWCDTI